MRAWFWAAGFWVLWLVGCAGPTQGIQTAPAEQAWTGRLVLKAESEPPTRFAAVFELAGTANKGRLLLLTPLGTAVARAEWDSDGAQLQMANTVQQFPNLDLLTESLTGIRVPVASLFAWLDGADQPADGWIAELSSLDTGRLTVRRVSPAPAAEIRILLNTKPEKKL